LTLSAPIPRSRPSLIAKDNLALVRIEHADGAQFSRGSGKAASSTDDGSEACCRKQILCLLRMGAAKNQGYKRESGGKTEIAQNLLHGFLFS
jgi:hypothetical protein